MVERKPGKRAREADAAYDKIAARRPDRDVVDLLFEPRSPAPSQAPEVSPDSRPGPNLGPAPNGTTELVPLGPGPNLGPTPNSALYSEVPGYTAVPNTVLDSVLKTLAPADQLVYLRLLRLT